MKPSLAGGLVELGPGMGAGVPHLLLGWWCWWIELQVLCG